MTVDCRVLFGVLLVLCTFSFVVRSDLFGVRCSFVVRCALFVACCLLLAVSRFLFLVWWLLIEYVCMLFVASCVSHVTWCMLFVVCCVLLALHC